MKIIHDIPSLYCKIIEDGLYKPKEDRLSVTDLINPPLIKHLKVKFWDDLQAPASDFLWLILGNAAHQVLESSGIIRKLRKISEKDDDAVSEDITNLLDEHYGEKPIEINIKGHRIRGRIDFRESGVITDFKITSVWSFIYGVKPEWEKQLNIYAFMSKSQGLPVNKLFVDAILRDWSKVQTYRNSDYPEKPFVSMPVKLWSEKEQYNYILSRIAAYDAMPSECSDEEKWAKKTTYAVKKKGKKRATRVLNTAEEANQYIKDKDDDKLIVEVRPGECTRCLHYCPVRYICPFSPHQKDKEK